MSELTAFFGGEAGKPYAGSTGVLIGKTPTQLGINSVSVQHPTDILSRGVSEECFVFLPSWFVDHIY
jgi:hypothetical protein